MTIVALLFFLSGVCIILFTEILNLAKRFVMLERTPDLSLTSNLKYKELVYSLLFKTFTFFLLFDGMPKGFLILPLKIETKSVYRDEDVGPGPAPSPCKMLSPTGKP